MPTAIETTARHLDETNERIVQRRLARVAADRARALRAQAAAITTPSLEPLRAALLRRAGELELAGAVLGDEHAHVTEPAFAVGA